MSKLKIEAVVAAPPQKVWMYWTKPEHITKWNFASPDWQCPSAQNELRVGGKYVARMEAKDGSFGFDFTATYNEVEHHKRISYTLDDGRVATTEFQDVGGKTKVVTTFDPENQHPLDFQKAGWQAILDNFKTYTENN